MANAEESQVSEQGKIFQDSVHGTIRLHPLLVKIIDTPQFQRLRNIKQMGVVYLVYPGACHNRFEHSLGTAHLAGKLARILQNQKKSIVSDDPKEEIIKITDVDVLCVEIAALCLDLGRGPFSYLFDLNFARRMKKLGKWTNSSDETSKSKPYKELSCEMLQFLIDENEDLKGKFEEYLGVGGDYQKNLKFIKEMICLPENTSFKGRGNEKYFLYDIVSNKRNKVDVGKWDYFARDCHHLGMKSSFDHERFMQCLEVRKDENGRNQICARDKECYNLYEMFHVRATLLQTARKHRVVNVIERMVCDAILEEVKSGSAIGEKVERCMDGIKRYAELDDNVFHTILHGGTAGSAILKRIQKRDLYTYLGTVQTTLTRDDITACLVRRSRRSGGDLEPDDFALVEVNLGYGDKSGNPVDHFLFFAKEGEGRAFHLRRKDISFMLPSSFSEREVQIFWKGGSHETGDGNADKEGTEAEDNRIEMAKDCLENFCKESKIVQKFRPDLVDSQGNGNSRKRSASPVGDKGSKTPRETAKCDSEKPGPSRRDT